MGDEDSNELPSLTHFDVSDIDLEVPDLTLGMSIKVTTPKDSVFIGEVVSADEDENIFAIKLEDGKERSFGVEDFATIRLYLEDESEEEEADTENPAGESEEQPETEPAEEEQPEEQESEPEQEEPQEEESPEESEPSENPEPEKAEKTSSDKTAKTSKTATKPKNGKTTKPKKEPAAKKKAPAKKKSPAKKPKGLSNGEKSNITVLLELIRDAEGTMSQKDMVKALEEKGIKLSPASVNTWRTKFRRVVQVLQEGGLIARDDFQV